MGVRLEDEVDFGGVVVDVVAFCVEHAAMPVRRRGTEAHVDREPDVAAEALLQRRHLPGGVQRPTPTGAGGCGP